MFDNDNDYDYGEDEGHRDTDNGDDTAQTEHTVLVLVIIFKETSLDISCHSSWVKHTSGSKENKIKSYVVSHLT